MTAPDRPGDREQQQAAERIVANFAAALAAARAEEAARWQAKIAALIFGFDGGGLSSLQLVELLRAVLDGEQR